MSAVPTKLNWLRHLMEAYSINSVYFFEDLVRKGEPMTEAGFAKAQDAFRNISFQTNTFEQSNE